MATAIVDIGVAIRRYLLSDAGVAAEVSDRVFIDDLPESENESMPRKCVILRSAGGPDLRSYTDLQRQRFDVMAFGATRFEAGEVDAAVVYALHWMRRNVKEEAVLHSAVLSGGSTTFKAAQTGWPIKMRTVLVSGSMNAAT